MVLEGVVTNVAAFGAFVDIGVHQDGLVHVSALANRFVKNPHDVVKPGQVVKVKVIEVDVKRQRIALSMRLGNPTAAPARTSAAPARASTPAAPRVARERKPVPGKNVAPGKTPAPREPQMQSAMALAFAKLKK
jgi:uncharacterized protein